ncbi:site-specific integrase [Methylocapsa sp. D3K7]|uniref:site-specific integrase n=1 Tax=Methylocapsa sp. D3K7 TaxID=3041435 RepID=UPI00244E8512|nr:site-specific integrase [Methylocapsa sp. D3K7]WGJ15981.1 site-specific integrase [Methylocapsa sp. D3K7]
MSDLSGMTLPGAVPAGREIALHEPSFEEAIAAIVADPDLPADVKNHWPCSLRRLATFLDRPIALVPARWTAVHIPASRLKPTRLGVTQKTLANHLSNVRAALAWMRQEKSVPARGMRLSRDWEALRDVCPKLPHRTRLLPLMRFCSARNIAVSAVDEAVIDSFLDYRRCTTSLAADAAARRSLARHWNDLARTVPGWPSKLLFEPPSRKAEAFPPWEAYPIGLRYEIEAYLESLTRVRRTAKGKRVPPARATTIRGRRAMLEAALRMATRIGIGMEELGSLSAFLNPAVSRQVLDAYWAKSGEEPSIFTIDLVNLFVNLARSSKCLPADKLEELDDIRADLEHYRPEGMTDKNLAAIRTFMQSDAWRELHHLPEVLMEEAVEASYSSPIKAAVRAQMAVAIAILNVAPIRRRNLGTIRLKHNLIRTGGPQTPYRLVFPNYDVKNRVKLDFPLDAELTALIDDHLSNYRPALIDCAEDLWLFPGAGKSHKLLTTLSDQITPFIEKRIGLRLTVHQFRHVSAAIILKHQPGNYELVRLLLGHRTVQVTIRNYIGLESTHASEVYGDLVQTLRQQRAGQGDDD